MQAVFGMLEGKKFCDVQETLREISLKVLEKNNCEKYCTGQENVKQDTCKV